MPTCVDFLGNEIKVGDVVCYAVTAGHSVAMKFGYVWKVAQAGNRYNPDTRRHDKEHFHLGICAPDYGGTPSKRTLTEVQRVVLVPPAHYNEDVRRLITACQEGAQE